MPGPFVQGRTNNHLTFLMVDATDFATPESALSAAMKIKIYGMLHTATAINFVTSGTGSLTNDIQHVGASAAGVYNIALAKADLSDASAAWYDRYAVILSATGAAQQTFIVDGERTNTSYISNVLSNLSAIASDIYSALALTNSRVLLTQSQASDTYSLAQQVNSRVLLNQSRISDTYSMLSDMYSDFQSRVPKRVATDSQLSDLHSDLRSFLVVMSGIQSDIYSGLSDLQSDFQSRVPKRVATDSQLSDLTSDLRSLVVLGVGVTISAMSDIASAVWADTIGARVDSRLRLVQSQASDAYSMLSDFYSDFQSRVPKLVSTDSQAVFLHDDLRALINGGISVMVSDIQSFLSDMNSDLRSLLTTTGVQLNLSTMSDLRSAIVGATTTVSASDISDIASAVWANIIGARVDSRLLLVQSNVSDVQSMMSDFLSDFQSRVPKRVATDSQLSDLHSDLRSYMVAMSSLDSDIYSLLSDMNSDLRSLMVTTGVQLNTSVMSDLRSAIAGVTVNLTTSDISDIASAVAAAVTTINASDISDIASAVKAALASDLSDILSAAVQTNSRVLLSKSVISDTYSMLSDMYSDFQSRVPKAVATQSQVSDLASDLRSFMTVMSGIQSDIYSLVGAGVALDASTMSDLRSAIVAGGTGTLTVSDISDIASAVWANVVGAQVNSRLLLAKSSLSDIYSSLSDLQSDFQSRVPKRVATDSQLSDLHSDLRSYMVGMSGMLSDVHSAATQMNSRTLLVQSQVSDIYSLLSDVSSDLGVMSGVQSDIYSGLSDLSSKFGARFPATIAELTGDPGATPTWTEAQAFVFGWLKNNSKSTSTKRFYRNSAGTTIMSATQGDDGVSYLQGKLS